MAIAPARYGQAECGRPFAQFTDTVRSVRRVFDFERLQTAVPQLLEIA
jgi:hypothetical protein